MNTFTLRRPSDMHVHWRRDERTGIVVPHTACDWAYVLAMPNTDPPIRTAADAEAYRAELEEYIGLSGVEAEHCRPLMTLKLGRSTTPEIIREAAAAGVSAVKIYPAGVTTNSSDGVTMQDMLTFGPVFEAMADVGMLLLIHGEKPGVYCLDRESAFLNFLPKFLAQHPNLKVVLEHITTEEAVDIVLSDDSGNLAATITLHHLYITLDDVVGDMLEPHNFCKPLAKRPEDRDALVRAALSGDPRFFFGSDSAPHMRVDKESSCGCAGVYSAPVALPLLMQFFEQHGKLDLLEPFVSNFGPEFYGLPLSTQQVTLVREPWTVPEEYSGIVPFWAGQEIAWQVQRD